MSYTILTIPNSLILKILMLILDYRLATQKNIGEEKSCLRIFEDAVESNMWSIKRI